MTIPVPVTAQTEKIERAEARFAAIKSLVDKITAGGIEVQCESVPSSYRFNCGLEFYARILGKRRCIASGRFYGESLRIVPRLDRDTYYGIRANGRYGEGAIMGRLWDVAERELACIEIDLRDSRRRREERRAEKEAAEARERLREAAGVTGTVYRLTGRHVVVLTPADVRAIVERMA